MNQSVRISHADHLLFSDWISEGKTIQEAGKILTWESGELDRPSLMAVIGGFDTVRSFNSIQIDYREGMEGYFPDTFRFEISQDGIIWEPILHESNFRSGLSIKGEWNFPLISARYVKLLFLVDRRDETGKYRSAFGPFRILISGIVRTEASSELDRLWVKENIIDERKDYGWSTSLRQKKMEEFISFDLGSINRISELRILSKDDPETFFPVNFHIVYSEDGIAWHHLIEENGFLTEPATWYRWRFFPVNMRFLKIVIDEGAKTREGKYISQIVEIEIFASPDMIEKEARSAAAATPVNVQFASVLRSGIVKLARDGEVREGVVVQGHDRRLRDATTETKGIVELASDGSDQAGSAVQGSDRRLKMATEDLPGIVRLARDGESRPGNVVQGNDHRLRQATEESFGIVELASDGESRSGVVVQGDDRRLRLGTAKDPGIVRFALDGEDRPAVAVQGSDNRLRNATTETCGIVRLARFGETADECAVQGSDPRLKVASTSNPGIVVLARNGEVAGGKAVQSDDSRLASSTEESAGIVRLCRPGGGMEGFAVQGNDPRLTDKREPLPHEHEYAPINHNYADHAGLIRIEKEVGRAYSGLVEPPLDFAPVTGVNRAEGAGVVGIGRDGLIGSGSATGVIGISPSGGAGMTGIARSGPGGVFISEKGFSLVAGSADHGRGVAPSHYAFLSEGASFFKDSLYLMGSGGSSGAIASYFEVDESDVISLGDVLIASKEKSGSLRKSLRQGDRGVIGVVVDDAAIIVNPPEGFPGPELLMGTKPTKPRGMELVAISGIVRVNATAQREVITPGDLLVTSIRSGKAEKLSDEGYRPGVVFARSLDNLPSGEGVIRAVLIGG
jgi:hypothetical protein